MHVAGADLNQRELRALLEWAIDGLPDGAREAFVLREVERLSAAETAAVLDVSEDVLNARLSRAQSVLSSVVDDGVRSGAPDVFRFLRPRCDRIVEGVMRMLVYRSSTGASDAAICENTIEQTRQSSTPGRIMARSQPRMPGCDGAAPGTGPWRIDTRGTGSG